MDSVTLQKYPGLSSQEQQASWGLSKRSKNSGEGPGKTMPTPTTPAATASLPPQQATQEDLPQLTTHTAWRLVGRVQAQALSSTPYRLAELQPVARSQMVAATYA